MNDPLPQNIEGSKRVTHSVEHRVDWGHVAIGLGLLAVAYFLFSGQSDTESDSGADWQSDR